MNQVTLIGRLVKDPEIVYVKEKQKLDFTIAVNSGKENVDFIPCTAWGKTAENMAKYLKKGSQICVVGELKNNNYEDSKGVKHYGMKVQVNNTYFLGSRSDVSYEDQTEKSIKQEASPYDYMTKPEPSPFDNVSNHNGIIDDDLPF